ncbi:two-partner secretion domain-containing protein [Paraburkholderia sp. HP33-1]|uniref:two-partner secretion domain-containing protein n=1 Tax=Paraburkholderia sp. HP33-1 TaxID=2883243 RepID=UPI001F22F449|nr:filamentous hemagglutinin N-terminal domain-containing protein [Paraburkholderia sp. HP33-1]
MLIGSVAAVVNAAPLCGQIEAGSGSIVKAGDSTTIQQNTGRLVIDWNAFSTNANESITFRQPDASAIALNRVVGQSPSVLLGKLDANGQVFIVNPNGVLFGSGAQVNVGGLIASTLNLSNQDFISGRYAFAGQPRSGAVVNLGHVEAAPGGYVALIGTHAVNRGAVIAPGGTAALAAGDRVTVTLGDHAMLGLSIDQGVLDALASNGGLIQTDGGQAWLEARAEGALLASVVNNSGVIRAHSVANQNGVIVLLAEGGTVQVGGRLDASAPHGGAGGSIETSGARVNVSSDASVDTASRSGATGNWLISAANFTIAANGGNITGTALSRLLRDNNIAVQATSEHNGTIEIDDALAWRVSTMLSLIARNSISINEAIDAPAATVVLSAGTIATQNAPLAAANLALIGSDGVYRLDHPFNEVGTLAARAASVTLDDQMPLVVGTVAGTVGVTTTSTTELRATSLTLDAPVSSQAQGTAVTLASASSFINHAGADAVVTPNGRWLIDSQSPDADVFGGLQSGNLALWGDPYMQGMDSLALTATGNRYGFAAMQQATLTANDISKAFGTTRQLDAGDVSVSLRYAGAQYDNAFTDSATVHPPLSYTLASAGAAADAAVGPYALILTAGGTQPAGYSVSTQSGATLQVTQAVAPVAPSPPEPPTGTTPSEPAVTASVPTPIGAWQTVAAQTGADLARGARVQNMTASLQPATLVQVASDQSNSLSPDAWPGNVCRK